MLKRFSLAIVAAGLTGCASHSIYLPNQTLHTPSTTGKLWGGAAMLGAGADTRFTVVDNYTSNPPVEDPTIGKCNDDFLCLFVMQAQYNLGLLEKFDLVMGTHGFGGKFQLIGTPEVEGWKMSVQYTGTNRSKSKSQTVGATTESIETKVVGREPGISIGYQTSSGMVVYLAYHNLQFTADSAISNSGGAFALNDRSGNLEKLGLGVTTEKKGFFGILEGTLTRAKYEDAEEFTDGTIGFWGGYQW